MFVSFLFRHISASQKVEFPQRATCHLNESVRFIKPVCYLHGPLILHGVLLCKP